MGVRSLGNALASFRNKFGTTGLEQNPETTSCGGRSFWGTKINHNNVNYHVFTGTGPFSAPGDFNTSVNYIILGGGGGAGYSSPSGTEDLVVVEQEHLLISHLFHYQDHLVLR